MKVIPFTLMTALLGLAACSTEPNSEIPAIQEQNTPLASKADWSLNDILDGIRAWEDLREDETALLQLFGNANSLEIDMELFPQNVPLHAYACLLDGVLKFAVISEVYDHAEYYDNLRDYIYVVDTEYTDISPLSEQTYEDYTFSLPTQYILAVDALNRIEEWNNNYAGWLSGSPVYQSFHIPTYSLEPQVYTGYFGLKDSEETPGSKEADLVLDNNAGVYFDTVHGVPPYHDRSKYYILDLL